jgi:hypothetical protein
MLLDSSQQHHQSAFCTTHHPKNQNLSSERLCTARCTNVSGSAAARVAPLAPRGMQKWEMHVCTPADEVVMTDWQNSNQHDVLQHSI